MLELPLPGAPRFDPSPGCGSGSAEFSHGARRRIESQSPFDSRGVVREGARTLTAPYQPSRDSDTAGMSLDVRIFVFKLWTIFGVVGGPQIEVEGSRTAPSGRGTSRSSRHKRLSQCMKAKWRVERWKGGQQKWLLRS